jgi:HlyD family secretion protein
MNRRPWLTLLVIIAVTANAAAYYTGRTADTLPARTTAVVTRGDLVQSVDATGTLEAVTTVQVGTQVSGVRVVSGA